MNLNEISRNFLCYFFQFAIKFYYFEIKQEDGNKKYGKSKEHRPNPIIQMDMFMDGDGIPLAFSTFAENVNEQTSLKPLEKKILGEFGCQKFIYCSDADLGSESIREYNHMGERAYIVTQSIKRLKKEEKEWALDPQGFKKVSDDTPVDITKLDSSDKGLYYKDEPYTTKKLHQRLIITYSPKYTAYQRTIRDKQVERAQKMLDSENTKKSRKNPNDPACFIEKTAVTPEGEEADIKYSLDENKIAEETLYDGLYAVCTDLLDDNVANILKVSEGRWQIEESRLWQFVKEKKRCNPCIYWAVAIFLIITKYGNLFFSFTFFWIVFILLFVIN